MNDRKLGNWIDSYMEYVEDTESSRVYKKWVAVSVVAAALRRKVKFILGRIEVFPNFYIVLVGPPGARKTQAIKFGHRLLHKLEDIYVAADCVTREALIQDFCKAKMTSPMHNDTVDHCSITVFSAELETFLGSRAENTKMLTSLTDLWDCPDKWIYRTKGQGTDEIVNVFINLIGATTPDSIASSIPPTAIGSGFTSRIIFCYAPKKDKRVAIPKDTHRVQELRASLIHDLGIISRLHGHYHFSKEGEKFWIDWYEKYDDQDPHRICKEPTFNGWYERKTMFILKLSMVLAASESHKLEITPYHMQHAIKMLEEVELTMGDSFKVVGRSAITAEVDIIFSLVKRFKKISEHKLLDIAWKDCGGRKFHEIMDTVTRTGNVKRSYSPKGEIFYEWTGAD